MEMYLVYSAAGFAILLLLYTFWNGCTDMVYTVFKNWKLTLFIGLCLSAGLFMGLCEVGLVRL